MGNGQLTRIQRLLLGALLTLVPLVLLLIGGAARNYDHISELVDASYGFYDLADIQRSLLQLRLDTVEQLANGSIRLVDLQTRRDLLANQLHLAGTESSRNTELVAGLSAIESQLLSYDQFLALIEANPAEAQSAYEATEQSLAEAERLGLQLMQTQERASSTQLGEALDFQLLAQRFGIILVSLFIGLNAALALSLRKTIRADFAVAYDRLRAELRERRRAERELLEAKEAAEEASVAKTSFLRTVSHELKTPMAYILGYAEMIADGEVGPVSQDQAHYLGEIAASVKRMDRLVAELTDISRIEAGRMELALDAVDVASVVKDVVLAGLPNLRSRRQIIHVDVCPNLPPLWADPGRLYQILLNILGNAHKYTPEEGVITLLALPLPMADGQPGIQVAVADNGIGIAAADRPRVFTQFFRTPPAEEAAIPGTGLGLNITRNLVELHGGRIWFESEPGLGSTFYVHLATLVSTPETA